MYEFGLHILFFTYYGHFEYFHQKLLFQVP